MRALLRSVVLWPCCLVACSSTLASPDSGPTGPGAYRVDWIEQAGDLMPVGASDINSQGQVVGDALGASSQEAFTWSAAGGLVGLARVDTAYYMEAVAINDGGVIAGNAWWEDGT